MKSSLLGLAMLKVSWDGMNRDYIDFLVPMAAECIKQKQHTVVSLTELQRDFELMFGLRLPQHVLKSILRRMRSKGLVKVDNRVYVPVPGKLDKLDFSKVSSSVVDMHNALVNSLQRYVHETFRAEWSVDNAETALQSYLREHDQTRKSAVIRPTSRQPEGARYMVAMFVQHAVENDPYLAKCLDTFAKGSMLADAMFLVEPGNQQMRFRNTDIYLDTSILMNALGYNGEPRQIPSTELLGLARTAGIRLKCFSHTMDEIRGILRAHASSLTRSDLRDAYGPAFEFFLSQGFSASDIELLAINLEAELTQLHVDVVDKPEYISQYVIDESGLESILEDRVRYSRPAPLKHDVDCISAIARLRRGRLPQRLEDCRALFVTQNNSLAWASRDFFLKEYSYAVPPCITDYVLASLLWLKLPSSAPDLPMKRLVANCYAAIQPSEELWRQYLKEVEKLRESGGCTADEYYALRCSLHAKNALMECTFGMEEAFVEGTVHEVLSAAMEKITADAKIDAEKKLADEREKRIEAEQTADNAVRQVTDVHDRVSHIGATLARGTIWALQGVAAVVLITGVIATLMGVGLNDSACSASPKLIFELACVAVWSTCSFLGAWHGTTMNRMFARLRTHLECWITSCIVRILRLDPQHASEEVIRDSAQV